MDTTEKLLDLLETNKKITEKIKALADKQKNMIDDLLFILIIEEDEDKEDDSA